jgi:hypothetical protein
MIGVPTGLPVDPTDDHLARTPRTPILLRLSADLFLFPSRFKLQASSLHRLFHLADRRPLIRLPFAPF